MYRCLTDWNNVKNDISFSTIGFIYYLCNIDKNIINSLRLLIMNNLFRNVKVLLPVLLGLFMVVALTSCEKDNNNSNLVLIEPLTTLAEMEGWYDPNPNGLVNTLMSSGMLIIKDQEVLEETLPNLADEINLEGKMLVLAGVGLSSGSASRVLNLYHNTDDDTYICRIIVSYPPYGTCDAPFVILSNVYPLINDSISFEIVKK